MAAGAGLDAKVGGKRESVAPGQRDVGDDDIGHQLERPRVGVLCRFALGDAEAAAFEKLGVAFARERIILDE